MTLVLSIAYDGGIVMASDSAAAESTFGFLYPGEAAKITRLDRVLVGHAGDGDRCARIVEAVQEHGIAGRPRDIANAIGRAATEESQWPHRWWRKLRSGLAIQFVVAGCDTCGDPILYEMHSPDGLRPTPRCDAGFVLIGRWQVAHYLLSKFWRRGLSRAAAERLAALAIVESAKTLGGVDDRVQIAAVTPEAAEGPIVRPDLTASVLSIAAPVDSEIAKWLSASS